MDFRNRLIEELDLTEIQANTLLKNYIDVCEKLAKEYHAEQLLILGIRDNAYRYDLLAKIDSMKSTASKLFIKDSEFLKGNNVALDNMREHITKIFIQHN